MMRKRLMIVYDINGNDFTRYRGNNQFTFVHKSLYVCINRLLYMECGNLIGAEEAFYCFTE